MSPAKVRYTGKPSAMGAEENGHKHTLVENAGVSTLSSSPDNIILENYIMEIAQRCVDLLIVEQSD